MHFRRGPFCSFASKRERAGFPASDSDPVATTTTTISASSFPFCNWLLGFGVCVLLAIGQFFLFQRHLPSFGGVATTSFSMSPSTSASADAFNFERRGFDDTEEDNGGGGYDNFEHHGNNNNNIVGGNRRTINGSIVFVDGEEATTPIPIADNNKNNSTPPNNNGDGGVQRLPDSLIIGVRKGGTRALLDALSLHPRIRVARREVHFFDSEEHYRRGGPGWYRAQMPLAGPNEIVIEKTPAYFTANPLVPKRVFQLNPKMKLILIIREPVMRTISDFTQIQQTKMERHKAALDFQKMSFINGKNGTVEINAKFKPIRNSLYAQHLNRWLKYFPLSQILVLDGDKFIKNPLSQIRLAEHFLGLEPAIRLDQFVFNANKGFFCFRPNPNAAMHCLGQSKGRKQINISPEFRQLLHTKFAPHNRQFFVLLNRHFPKW